MRKATRRERRRWSPVECPECGDEAFYVDLDGVFCYRCDDCEWESESCRVNAPAVNTTRRSRRTDVGRRRCEFVGGRSIPVFRQALGLPHIFRFSIGSAVVFGREPFGGGTRRPHYVIGIDYRLGTLTVPLHDEAYGRLLSLLVQP